MRVNSVSNESYREMCKTCFMPSSLFLVYFLKVGLCDLLLVRCTLLTNFNASTDLYETYVMAPEPISTAYFIEPISPCVYICIPLSLIIISSATNVTAVTSTHASIAFFWTRRFLCGLHRIKGKYAIISSQNFLFLAVS